MRHFLFAALTALLPLSSRADTNDNLPDAKIILARVSASRPTKDFSLKARLFVGHADPVPVQILVWNGTNETRTIYRGGQTEALVIQPVNGAPRFYLRGAGELAGARRAKSLLGSQFSYYDLGLPFLHWPNAKLLGESRVRGRDCFVIESAADGEPYARVKMWIDEEYFALLRAEAFDAKGTLTRRFAITSFKRIGDIWIPRGLEASVLLPYQSLPSEEKSRLEIYEGNYDAALSAEQFAPERFQSTASR
ncbi:MAG TPA: outer membrane lipoprotein-sorting protein [Verrucomicrobiae bacterium]|nr:outer membrane lipoprotein-sorting protein [Verrucomicrobiae bacterium]